MDQREYLVKAQEAEAFANAAEDPVQRLAWESIAGEYRQLAQAARELRTQVESESE